MVRLKRLDGFSILESLIAISVLLVVITSCISLLSTRNFQSRARIDVVNLTRLQLFNSGNTMRLIYSTDKRSTIKNTHISDELKVELLLDHEGNVVSLNYLFSDEN